MAKFATLLADMARRVKRQLIQFSTYSVAVVLPKKMLRSLGWQSGDAVEIRLDSAKKCLVIGETTQAQVNQEPAANHPPVLIDKSKPSPVALVTNTSPKATIQGEVLPIPEIPEA